MKLFEKFKSFALRVYIRQSFFSFSIEVKTFFRGCINVSLKKKILKKSIYNIYYARVYRN